MKHLYLAILLSCLSLEAFAQVDARMLRYPDVSATHITFVYAGDIWVAPKDGGVASRLSSPAGQETFPRFSPDGSQIAFSGNYDGNTDIYVIPSMGGTPERITHHPMSDRMLDWHPDGKRVLYASSMESGKQRFSQFYLAPSTGGMPEKLPIPYGEFGMFSSDGNHFAYMPQARDFRTWKRYRGGSAPDIWLFDLETMDSENVTSNPANDSQPMWHNNTLYFMSDRGPNSRYNIWAYDMTDKAMRQVTRFSDFDIHFSSLGPEDIVYEAGGRLYLLDLATETQKEVVIDVVTDQATLKPRMESVDDLIQFASISPSGKRAVFEARGEVFTVPAEHGIIRNLTMSSGYAERYPTWSPDGKYVAYWSDRSGEYELTLRAADGSGAEKVVTELGPGFRYRTFWSPDSKKLAFVDQTMDINIVDAESGDITTVDKGLWLFEGGLRFFRVSWSADSRWMAYSRGLENRKSAVFLYDTANEERHQVTSGFYSDATPAFDPDGKYLYFLSDRSLSPAYSDLDNTFIYPNTTNIVAVTLRKDVPSPLAPRNDEEEVSEEESEESEEEAEEDEAEKDEEEKQLDIDLEDLERRLIVLPPEAGNYSDLAAVSGKVLYRRLPKTGSGSDQSPIVYFDLKEREEKTVLDDANGYVLSANGEKMLVRNGRTYAIVNVGAGQKMDKPLRTGEMEMNLDPKEEWKQIFADSWRFQRDFFYDTNMHGVDWDAMRTQYGNLVDDAVTRWDLNFIIGELIAELNASHTYRGGGDTESADFRGVGLLGVDWKVENGAYRVAKIVDGAAWDSEVRSPLAVPGVDVSEGDYVLAVNGMPMDVSRDPWAAFSGLAGKTVTLTVNSQPTMEGAREVLVETLSNETRLRNLAWIEGNRKRVEEASNGQLGYIYVPDTGINGQTELIRQFTAQFNKRDW